MNAYTSAATRLSADVPELLEALAAAAERPLAQATALPAGLYTDPAFYALERQQVLRREWLPIAHLSQVATPGEYLRVDLLDEPLLVVHGEDGRVRVLSRVCQHRGMDMMPPGYTPLPEHGTATQIQCPYHLWTYRLDGRLRAAPEMQGSQCHETGDVCLPEFRSEVFAGFVFVTLDPEAPPLAETFANLGGRYLDKLDLGGAKLVWEQHWDCPFNWKVLVENFMEPYHHMGAHRRTLEPLMPARGCWTEPEVDAHHLAVHLPLREKIQARLRACEAGDPGFTPFPGLSPGDHLEWWVFLGYPLFLLFVAPDRAFWYRLIPTGPQTCSLLTTLLVSEAATQAEDFEAMKARAVQEAIDFHLEDMEVCAGIQRGLNSACYTPGALSHLEEPILHIHRYLARRLCATDAV